MVDTRAPESGPLNPFESSFALFKALSDQVRSLRVEVEDLRLKHDARCDKVENDLAAAKSFLSKRCDNLETSYHDEKVSRNTRLERMSDVVDELRKVNRVRLDQLDAQMKQVMTLPFEQSQALDQKWRSEAEQLRNYIEKHSVDFGEHRQKAFADQAADRNRYDELRHDVEKLAALLSQSSLNRDPFNQLGFQNLQPSGPLTALGTTAHGSSLPPLMAASAKVGGRDPGSPAFTSAPTVRFEGSKF
jgi:hypothetical protein